RVLFRSRKFVEVRPEMAGESFQLVQGSQVFASLRIQRERCWRGVASRTATSRLSGTTGVGGRIRTQEELGIAADSNLLKRLLMDVALQNGQTVEVGTNTAHQHMVAVVHQ